ncbi:MAG: TRAP transporter small permease [Deltaproteobacteria bacterium]|nr:TRAP transporter small permease [Deltaproteobacteria bacterium]
MFAVFEKYLSAIAGGILLLAMMLLVSADVVGRYFFDLPIEGTMELVEFMMVALLYFSLAHTQAVRGHIKVDIFLSHFSEQTQLFFDLISCLLGLFLFILITWQSLAAAINCWKFWETTFGVLALPIFPAKVLVPFGCLLLCIRYLIDIRGIIRNILHKESLHANP